MVDRKCDEAEADSASEEKKILGDDLGVQRDYKRENERERERRREKEQGNLQIQERYNLLGTNQVAYI